MGARSGAAGTGRGRSGRHRRRPLPAPSASSLIGIAVLVLLALGALHLSTTGSAVPLDATTPSAAEEATTGPPPDDPEETESPEPPSGELVVHVSGAVASPGVVRLPAGSRVDDALQAAGGATEEADLAAVNLARPLADGEQVHLPRPGEEPPPAPDPSAPGDAGGEGPEIDLNTAGAAELEELPGVGPALARRIIEHREGNGPFTAVDDLLEVSGIGPATLEEIRGRAVV
ncbi:ComEA family DNA-binding protein [Brachybacterium sp. YJGR34]|uniref:ComEA family DNA-binding protein n=1 Tax=Brachybacterium sp. YJGR34 TaxID=2059911 RepID=UPI000E0A896D|nr:ComEA family DNA-binding protein [Brachybacterium sp. YJGR34]